MNNLLVISFIKSLFMNLSISYSIIKIENTKYSNKGNYLIILMDILISLLYGLLRYNFNQIIAFSITYSVFFIIIIVVLHVRNTKIVLIAFPISIISFLLGSIFNYLIINIEKAKFLHKTIIETFLIGIVQFGLIYAFFEIRRFKNRFCIFNK